MQWPNHQSLSMVPVDNEEPQCERTVAAITAILSGARTTSTLLPPTVPNDAIAYRFEFDDRCEFGPARGERRDLTFADYELSGGFRRILVSRAAKRLSKLSSRKAARSRSSGLRWLVRRGRALARSTSNVPPAKASRICGWT
jgi:hypothetical protein